MKGGSTKEMENKTKRQMIES